MYFYVWVCVDVLCLFCYGLLFIMFATYFTFIFGIMWMFDWVWVGLLFDLALRRCCFMCTLVSCWSYWFRLFMLCLMFGCFVFIYFGLFILTCVAWVVLICIYGLFVGVFDDVLWFVLGFVVCFYVLLFLLVLWLLWTLICGWCFDCVDLLWFCWLNTVVDYAVMDWWLLFVLWIRLLCAVVFVWPICCGCLFWYFIYNICGF